MIIIDEINRKKISSDSIKTLENNRFLSISYPCVLLRFGTSSTMDFPQKGIIKIQVLYVSYDNNFIKNKKKRGKEKYHVQWLYTKHFIKKKKQRMKKKRGK